MLENSPPNYVEQRSKAVGVFLIAADTMTFVLFFMSGVLCIVWLFRSWKAAEVEETKKNKSDSGVRCRLRKKSTMVVPVPLPLVVMPKGFVGCHRNPHMEPRSSKGQGKREQFDVRYFLGSIRTFCG